MMWLDKTPRAVVRAHLTMLPRLHAREALRASQRMAVGSGALRREAARQVLHEWLRLARADEPLERLSPQAMGTCGIGYRRVSKRQAAAGAAS